MKMQGTLKAFNLLFGKHADPEKRTARSSIELTIWKRNTYFCLIQMTKQPQ